jgi:branched-chain amino acid transport system ATP-binding protein
VGALLEIKDLDVHYGAIHALRGVNVTVEEGQIATLIGSNGAGKSTTLRAVSGLIKPSRGSIRFKGAHDLAALPPHQIVRLGISQAPEGRGIFANLTVDENLQIGSYTRRDGAAAIAKDRDEVFALFPKLKERIAQSAGTLSGGEQQMLAIGRALLARPTLLLLDEPSLGLAPQVVQTIFKIIRDINARGTTILLVEQNAHMALGVAHRGYVLEVGEIKMSDDAKVLAASDEVKRAYLGIG